MNAKSFAFISLSLLAFACTDKKASLSYTQAEIDEANNLITQYGLNEMPLYDELLKYRAVETKDAKGLPKLPWTDTYWATTEKQLAARWGVINSADEDNQDPFADFKIGAYFQTQIQSLKTTEPMLPINLSPAEKFDIAYRSVNGLTLDENNESIKGLASLDTKHQGFLNPELVLVDRVRGKRTLAAEYLDWLNGDNSVGSLSPLAAQGYRNWINNAATEGNIFPGETTEDMDWSWEGICHGWAPAAVMSEEPKYAVKVKVKVNASSESTKELLFTEGDIRALLDKSWADSQSEAQFFIGRRCEENLSDPQKGVPSNAQGRGVSGRMTYINEAGVETTGDYTIVQEYARKSGNKSLYRVILENEWQEGAPKYAYLVLTMSATEPAVVELTFDEKVGFAQLETPVSTAGLTLVKDVQSFGCWDMNPASFHAVLVENLGKKNLGIVMDRTQSGQVWNQPIGKASFEIGGLQSVDKLKSDKAKPYRAPGTAFIAEVKAHVFWSSEPRQPRLSYTVNGKDFDATMIRQTNYEYTLEFDADKRLIGGEWGTLSTFKTHENPDFIFGYQSKVEPDLDSADDFLRTGYQSVIKKIHDCSLHGQVKGTVEVIQAGLNEGAQTIKFVECEL
jgi:hypothetical protein